MSRLFLVFAIFCFSCTSPIHTEGTQYNFELTKNGFKHMYYAIVKEKSGKCNIYYDLDSSFSITEKEGEQCDFVVEEGTFSYRGIPLPIRKSYIYYGKNYTIDIEYVRDTTILVDEEIIDCLVYRLYSSKDKVADAEDIEIWYSEHLRMIIFEKTIGQSRRNLVKLLLNYHQL